MNKIEFGDCREIMRRWAAEGVKAQMCVTSPPYFGLRDYGVDGQLGLEKTPEEYIANLVEVFRCVRDVLADDGTLWVNIGDSYASRPNGPAGTPKAGSIAPHVSRRTAHARRSSQVPDGLKHKDLIGIPWMLAFALRADGWYLRQDIIWHKPNPMPESVNDRCTKAHEYLFLLSKSRRYYFNAEAIKEPAVSTNRWAVAGAAMPGKPNQSRSRAAVPPRHASCGSTQDGLNEAGRDGMRNRRSVWTMATRPYKGAHFATFPPGLITPCILAGSRPGDTVLDPFMGSGTTAEVSLLHGRQYLGCELNHRYGPLQDRRIAGITNATQRRSKPRKPQALDNLPLFIDEEAAA